MSKGYQLVNNDGTITLAADGVNDAEAVSVGQINDLFESGTWTPTLNNVANDVALLEFVSVDTANRTLAFSFSYRII